MDNKNISNTRRRNGHNKPHNTDGKKSFFIDTIAKFCDKCGTAYNISDVHIVQESNFSSIIHFSCPNCKSNQIATFIKPMGMSSRVPVNSDLNVDEISSFAQYEKISSDDVLDMFAFLESEDQFLII